MTYSFDKFCADCRDALTSNPDETGREAIRVYLEKLLKDREFLAAECGADANPGIRTIYRDETTGYNVLVHIYAEGKTSPPHDHGKSWAIYGQATEYTDMTMWRLLKDDKDGPAELERKNTVRLEPGMAGKFEPGDIHSIHFPAGAKFVRVTGTDLSAIATRRFEI